MSNKKKPGVTEEWIIEKACEASRFYSVSCKTVADSRNFIRSLVELIPAKKATVSEAWINELIVLIAGTRAINWDKSYLEILKNQIYLRFEKVGVEVVKK